MNSSAVILAGGMGKRLGLGIPKALIGINDKTLIDYQIQWLNSYGITDIVLAMGPGYGQIVSHIKSKGCNNIKYSVEKTPLGTAGGLNQALKKVLNNTVIVVNVDDITDICIPKLLSYKPNTVCICRMQSPFGVVHTKNGKIVNFDEKPILKNVWINAGIYLLDKNIRLPEKGSLEYNVFPNIKLKAYKHAGFRYTFNTQKDMEQLEKISFFAK
jgi:NDP-sugar pyrophosphorylase family protein